MHWAAFTSGFALSLGLILAIGAQNAFMLKQGLKREHVGPLVALFAASDALLISVGVFGLGWVMDQLSGFERLARWGGAAFLAVYGLRSLRAAWRSGQGLQARADAPLALPRALALGAAFTWLNPHVYLDTVLLIGSVASRHAQARPAFAAGAALASLVFFAALGYGARLLAPWFAKPAAWRLLDALIGAVMLALAASLLLPARG